MPPPKYALNRGQYAAFMRHVTIQPDGCWLWTGPTTPNGYGKYRLPGQRERVAHRILWEHARLQEVPDGMQLDHLCRTRLCVNPDHFEVVTPSENTMRQAHANRLKTHCKNGHEYTPDNTSIDSAGKRRCKTCHREREARRRSVTT